MSASVIFPLSTAANSSRTLSRRARHFQRGAVFHTQRVVVASAPVGDDRAVKAPLTAQDLHEQVLILVGIGTVHKIVGRHNAAGMPLFDGNFKPGQVNFPQVRSSTMESEAIRRVS